MPVSKSYVSFSDKANYIVITVMSTSHVTIEQTEENARFSFHLLRPWQPNVWQFLKTITWHWHAATSLHIIACILRQVTLCNSENNARTTGCFFFFLIAPGRTWRHSRKILKRVLIQVHYCGMKPLRAVCEEKIANWLRHEEDKRLGSH